MSQAVDAAKDHKRASLAVGNRTISTWGSVKATEKSAVAAGLALNKVQYANAILEMLDNARFEKSIEAGAINMLNTLESQEDPHQRVSNTRIALFEDIIEFQTEVAILLGVQGL